MDIMSEGPSETDILAGIRAKREAAGSRDTVQQPEQQQPTQRPEQANGTPVVADPANGGTPAQDEQAPALDPVQRYTVTLKGDDGADITEELTLDELRSGYMRQSDHSRKSQEISKARAEVPTLVEKAASEARTQYLQGLQYMEQLVVAAAAPELQNVNWQQLANENPGEYVRLMNRRDQINNTLQAIRAQRNQQELQAKAKENESKQVRVSEAIATLKREIPGYSDEHYSKLLHGAQKTYGYSLQDYGERTDPRDIIVLNDALKYRELVGKKPATEAALKGVPNAIKPGASVPRSDVDQVRVEKAKKQLGESGDMEDAVALLQAKRKRG